MYADELGSVEEERLEIEINVHLYEYKYLVSTKYTYSVKYYGIMDETLAVNI